MVYAPTWDYENKLIRQHNFAGELATFTYDPDGLMVEQDNPGEPSGGHRVNIPEPLRS